MSDLKCERWSWRDSNSDLQVLQVSLVATTAFWAPSATESGSGSRAASFWEGSVDGDGAEECGEGRRAHESKKSGGWSNSKRCRFAVVVVAVAAEGRG